MKRNTRAFVSLAVAGALATSVPAALTAAGAGAAVTPSSATAGQSGSGTVPQITVTTDSLTYDDTSKAPTQAAVLAAAGVTATCGQPVIADFRAINFHITGYYTATVTDTCDGSAAAPQTITIAVVHPVPAGTYTPLPLGDPNLTETRTTMTLAKGVTLTHIVRGTTPANPNDINITPEGPWIVNVVTIDPKRAKGHLEIVRGQYLTDRETVGQFVAQAHGLTGINASFFDIDDNYGVPVGLTIDNGKLVGNPDGEQDANGVPTGLFTGPVVDSRTNKLVLNGTYSWSGTVENLKTGQSLALTEIDKDTFVPSACASMIDQTQCTVAGDLVHFDPVWGAETPTGYGVEVVVDKQGDVVATKTTRGVALKPGQTSIQATGSDAAALLNLVKGGGRLKTTLKLFNNGVPVDLTPDMQAATGSEILVSDGVNQNPEPDGDTGGSRNPETSIATTKNGDIILFTVEGRATTSVGVNFPEESAALMDLGAYNAEGLDGGGSTQLAADGQYVTTSSDGTERPDGDALVWVP
jgi:exopolysaccharide biosynthesis protein